MKLLALCCPQCGHALAPENDHIVVTCETCYTPVRIADDGLDQIPMSYAAPKSEAHVARWLPFWVFHGRVHITERVTQGGGSRQEEAERLWGRTRDLYVPAWELSLKTVQEIGSDLTQRQPALHTVSPPTPVRLTPVTFASADAVKMLEFIVLAIEAHRPDWLKHLDFRLELGEPVLWALPADESGLVAQEG